MAELPTTTTRGSLGVSRRTFLKGGLAALAVAGSPALLSACGSGGGGGSSTTVSIGSNYSDAGRQGGLRLRRRAAFQKSSGMKAQVNTVDHNTFQNKIQTYLQGTPDDVFSWFAGYRMKFFAAQGLASPIDDVWDKIGGNFPDVDQGGLEGRRRPLLLRPALQLPVGHELPEERLRRQQGYQVPRPGTS